MKKLIPFLLLTSALFAEDAAPLPKMCGASGHEPCVAAGSNPELDAAKARIVWLEQKLAATESKSSACFTIYGADMKLNQLAQQEPKAQEVKKGEEKK